MGDTDLRLHPTMAHLETHSTEGFTEEEIKVGAEGITHPNSAIVGVAVGSVEEMIIIAVVLLQTEAEDGEGSC